MNTNIAQIQPVRFSVSLPGPKGADGEMAGWRWVNDTAPPLLFCHATGFCASVYKQMLQHLGGAFDIFALDMRGHGRTSLSADPSCLRSWDIYSRDIATFLDSQKREGWTLAGHSMGGVTVAMAARNRSDIASLRLIEPVMAPGFLSLAAHMPLWRFITGQIPFVKRAAKRRAYWEDHDQVLRSYMRKPLFDSWADGVLGDYLEDGLKTTDDASADHGRRVALACDPQWEAATFAALANDIWSAIKRANVPIAVLAANHASSTVSPLARQRCKGLGVRVRELAGLTHLAPMIDPSQCAEFLANDI